MEKRISWETSQIWSFPPVLQLRILAYVRHRLTLSYYGVSPFVLKPNCIISKKILSKHKMITLLQRSNVAFKSSSFLTSVPFSRVNFAFVLCFSIPSFLLLAARNHKNCDATGTVWFSWMWLLELRTFAASDSVSNSTIIKCYNK